MDVMDVRRHSAVYAWFPCMFQNIMMGFEQLFECVSAHDGVIIEQQIVVPLVLSFQRFSPSQSHTTCPEAFSIPLNDV